MFSFSSHVQIFLTLSDLSKHVQMFPTCFNLIRPQWALYRAQQGHMGLYGHLYRAVYIGSCFKYFGSYFLRSYHLPDFTLGLGLYHCSCFLQRFDMVLSFRTGSSIFRAGPIPFQIQIFFIFQEIMNIPFKRGSRTPQTLRPCKC